MEKHMHQIVIVTLI